jgi:uncharacterized lipoprotein YmbA
VKTARAMAVAAILALLFPAGCTNPPPQLYVLNPIDAPEAGATTRPVATRSLAILPVSVPDYLRRRGIVARAANNRLLVSENQQWGEELSEGLTRVLTVDLVQLLGRDGVVVTSDGQQAHVDAELSLTIDAFERDPSGNAVLAARWTLLDMRSGGGARHFQAVFSEPAPAVHTRSREAATEVAALNQDLDRLATAIAESVRRLGRAR